MPATLVGAGVGAATDVAGSVGVVAVLGTVAALADPVAGAVIGPVICVTCVSGDVAEAASGAPEGEPVPTTEEATVLAATSLVEVWRPTTPIVAWSVPPTLDVTEPAAATVFTTECVTAPMAWTAVATAGAPLVTTADIGAAALSRAPGTAARRASVPCVGEEGIASVGLGIGFAETGATGGAAPPGDAVTAGDVVWDGRERTTTGSDTVALDALAVDVSSAPLTLDRS
jgi:hypothetical protein